MKCEGRSRATIWWALAAGLAWVAAAGQLLDAQARYTGPWDMAELLRSPAAAWGADSNGVQEVYYEGVPYQGHATRVFAYYAQPTNGVGPWPALLLVHGAAQHANVSWAAFWAGRGYAALAMDLCGWGPDGALPDGGPGTSNWQTEFEILNRNDVSASYFYHAVCAIVRGHALLLSRPEVDRKRVGVHGLSWGGFFTCIAAGIDDGLRLAVPVFGAGFIYLDNYYSAVFSVPAPAGPQRYIERIDPARYLPNVSCPMLFVSGATDPYFSPPSFQLSFQTVPEGLATLSVPPQVNHGCIWLMPWTDIEVRRFIDSQMLNLPALPRLGPLTVESNRASASLFTPLPLTKATLWCTTNLGAWSTRSWTAHQATVSNGIVTAPLPNDRPLAYYLSVTDAGSALVSTPCAAAGADGAPANCRFASISRYQSGAVRLWGNKPWGHHVELRAGPDLATWSAVDTNAAAGANFQFVLTNQPAVAMRFFQLRDLDW